MDRITEGTIEYLSHQIEAGAEVVKMFDSWAGSLKGDDFGKYALEPAREIIAALKARHPAYADHRLPARSGRELHRLCQGNGRRLRGARQFGRRRTGRRRMCRSMAACRAILPRRHMVTGGQALVDETRAHRRGVFEGAAYLQPWPRDHAGCRPGQRAADD